MPWAFGIFVTTRFSGGIARMLLLILLITLTRCDLYVFCRCPGLNRSLCWRSGLWPPGPPATPGGSPLFPDVSRLGG